MLPLHTFLPPNSATQLGLDDVRGYDSLAPAGWRRQRRSMGSFEALPTVSDAVEPWNIARTPEGVCTWNVKYLLLHPTFAFDPESWRAATGLELEEIYRGADGTVLENLRVQPRVRAPRGRTPLEARTPQRWKVTVESAEPTTVVIANPHYPGWEALVDDRPVETGCRPGEPITVPVPSGRHTVDLVYRPLSFRVGVAVATLSLCILAAVSRIAPGRAWRGCGGRPG